MRLLDIHADPHPDGHRIDVTWTCPPSPSHPGVRVVRRVKTHPTLPDDGEVVGGVAPSGARDGTMVVETHDDGSVTYRLADSGLQGERFYYYALFPYRGTPPDYAFDAQNRVSALAGVHHGTADQMMELLPQIYARYDGTDGDAGPLRRFLDLPGGQLDLLRTFADSILHTRDMDRVDGSLLPLLAQWIGWQSDYRRELDTQRNEIRYAPALYRRVGVIPTVEATVKRITGWESRTKEYVHNVARTNNPPRLTLQRQVLDGTGAPLVPEDAEGFDPTPNLLSIDDAPDGRPSAVTDGFGIRWLFYHTRRKGRFQIWHKTSPTLPISSEVDGQLEDPEAPGTVSEALQEAFLAEGHPIESTAAVTERVAGRVWVIDEGSEGERYVLEAADDGPWTAYHTSTPLTEWAPSQPLAVENATLKDPAAVAQDDVLWVFWTEYDEVGHSRIRYRRRAEGGWLSVHTLAHPGPGAEQPERRNPAAVTDTNGDLWLFRQERTPLGWALVYNVHDGTVGSDGALDAASETVRFPDDGGAAPQVHDDVFVTAATRDGEAPLVVFWARKESVPALHEGATRWRVAARRKTNLTPDDSASWEGVDPLPVDDDATHDREPAAVPLLDGTLLVVWASTRDGGWSIWRATYDPDDPTDGAWGAAEAVSGPPFAERAPALLGDPDVTSADDDRLLLIYRTSASRVHESELYGATVTEDARYSGSTTVRVTDDAALALRRTRADTHSYTYDLGPPTGRTDADWYARDTIGLFIEPETVDLDAVGRRVRRLRQILREFMPVTDRAVIRLPEWSVSPAPHTDYVYRYDAPPEASVGIIGESYSDHLSTVAEEGGPGLSDEAASTLTATAEESFPQPADDHSDSILP